MAIIKRFGDRITNNSFEIKKFAAYLPATFLSAPTPDQLKITTPPKLLVRLYYFCILKVLSLQEVLFEPPKTNIWASVAKKHPVEKFSRLKPISLIQVPHGVDLFWLVARKN